MTFTEIVQRARAVDSETGVDDTIQVLWDALFALAAELDERQARADDR